MTKIEFLIAAIYRVFSDLTPYSERTLETEAACKLRAVRMAQGERYGSWKTV